MMKALLTWLDQQTANITERYSETLEQLDTAAKTSTTASANKIKLEGMHEVCTAIKAKLEELSNDQDPEATDSGQSGAVAGDASTD